MADDTTKTGNQLVSFYQETPSKSNTPGVELLPIDRSNEFILHGPTAAGIVYVRHPLEPRELIAFADYDERLAQDRYEEALRVFTSLGAARIVAAAHRQSTKEAGGKLSVMGNGLSVGGLKDAAWSLAFNQEGDGGPPRRPASAAFPRCARPRTGL